MRPLKNNEPTSESTASYQAIAHYFPNVMIAMVSSDQRILFMEGDEMQKLGLRRERIEGKTISEIGYFSTQWKNRMLEYTRKTLTGSSFSYEIRHKGRVFRVNTVPLRDEQELSSPAPPLKNSNPRPLPSRVLFVYTNITEQKRTEIEILNALKKERELGELKSRFVSMASHEFRTPLSTILSSANLIARQNEPEQEDKRLKNVERIRSSVRNLVGILDEFLSLGRLEEGKVSANPEVFDLVDFMDAIVQELQHAHKPGQQVHITSPQPTIQVYVDKQFARNIFLNLLSNALKYSPEGKPVDIVVGNHPPTFSVKIIDRGVGIPTDEHKHLFDLFFRARNATNIQGTGLGLPIVKKYIDLMQGDIAVESELEKGTTITVTLPLKQAKFESV